MGCEPDALALIPKDIEVDLNGLDEPLPRAQLMARLKGKQGLICQITDEGKKIPLDVKAGDKILFGKYSGSEVKVDDKDYLILREEDILAILG